MTVGGFVAFNTYMVQLTWPMIALGWVINIFQRGTASMGRINEILVEQPEIEDGPRSQRQATAGESPATTPIRGRHRVPRIELRLQRRAGPS